MKKSFNSNAHVPGNTKSARGAYEPRTCLLVILGLVPRCSCEPDKQV